MPDKIETKINLITAIAFAVGAMIGGGVFVLTGVALQETGPSALLSFGIAGIIVLFSAMSFAVIASMAKLGDTGYVRVGDILGPVWGFLTAWCFYLAGIIGVAFILNAFGIYMHEFVVHNVSIITWAVISAIVLTLINLGPASRIGQIETLLVSVKLIILAILIVFGLRHFQISSMQPFMLNGISGVFTASTYLFIAFLGFNVITSISGEVENPRQTVPRAILLSMLVVTVVYIGIVIALLMAHITNYSEASVGLAAESLIGPIGGGLVVFGALVATLSAANASVLGSSEIMVSLAGRKQVPTILGHLRDGHPYVSVLAGGALYLILILTRQTTAIIDLANVTAIIALIIVNVAAIKAISNPDYSGFKLPGKWIIPSIGIIGALLQFIFIAWSITAIGVLLTLSGFVIYSLRDRYHIPHLHLRIITAIKNRETPLLRVLRRK